MKFKLLLLVSAGIATAIAGCTETTVIPQSGEIFTITHTGATELAANSAAIVKAKDVCEQQGATNVKVLDQSSVYKGLDKSQQTLIKLANKTLSLGKTSPDYIPTNHNYKTTLVFKCTD